MSTSTINLYKFYSKYKTGVWGWDDRNNSLVLVSNNDYHELLFKRRFSSAINIEDDLKFKHNLSLLEKIRFRRYFQRKSKPDEPKLIILQDIKDVVLFLADAKSLSVEFIEFFHTHAVDKFLRALIIYFQFYFQVLEKLSTIRSEMLTKLQHPNLTTFENKLQSDLSDLRSMVSREFCSILYGAEETKRFHHIMSNKNKTSMSDKDRKLYFMLLKICVRIVWVALLRPEIVKIDYELNRLMNSEDFNMFINDNTTTKQELCIESEKIILEGVSNVPEYKLNQRSPLGKEILIENHDQRLLAVGLTKFPPSDQRLEFLEAAYSAPEEKLAGLGITVGILGRDRSDYNEVLEKKKTKPDDEIVFRKQKSEFDFQFDIPAPVKHSDDTIPAAFPQIPPTYVLPTDRKKLLKNQCKVWRNHVQKVFSQTDGSQQKFSFISSQMSTQTM